MEPDDTEIVRKNYVRLVDTLEAQKILGYLYQEGVLSLDDIEQIKALSTSKEQNEKLLVILEKRKDGLKVLIKALSVSGVQAFLGNELLESVTWNEKDVENFKLELEGKIDQNQMLKVDMATLKQENNRLKAKNQMLEENVAALKQENYQLKAKDLKTLNAENDELKTSNDENQNWAKVTNSDIDKLRITELMEEIDQLKQTNKKLNNQKKVLEDNVAASRQENEELKEKNAKSRNTILIKKKPMLESDLYEGYMLLEANVNVNDQKTIKYPTDRLEEKDDLGEGDKTSDQLLNHNIVVDIGERVKENNDIIGTFNRDAHQTKENKQEFKQEKHQIIITYYDFEPTIRVYIGV